MSLSDEDRELDRMLRTVNAAMDAQAAEIERLRASLAEAVGVLRPFGEAATSTERCYTHALPDNLIEPHGFSMSRLRAARDFITKHGGGS